MVQFRKMFAACVRAHREMAAQSYAIDAQTKQWLIEYDVPPGHTFDLHGDGAVKPKEECAPPPDFS